MRLEDSYDSLSEFLNFGVGLGIIPAIEFAAGFAHLLQGVEDAFVVGGLGKDPGNIAAIVPPHAKRVTITRG